MWTGFKIAAGVCLGILFVWLMFWALVIGGVAVMVDDAAQSKPVHKAQKK